MNPLLVKTSSSSTSLFASFQKEEPMGSFISRVNLMIKSNTFIFECGVEVDYIVARS